MKKKIFYQVKGTIFRNKGDENDLIEVNEHFTGENPVPPQEKIYSCYQHYMDICPQGHGKEDNMQKEILEELGYFVNAYRSKFASSGYMIIDEMDSDAD